MSAQHLMTYRQAKQQNPWAYQIDYPAVPAPQYFTLENQDKLYLLQNYDTMFLVDDSYSMVWCDMKGMKSRSAIAGTWLAVLAEVAARYDTNGIDIQFLNSPLKGKNIKTKEQVRNLFDRVEPNGSTPTGSRIDAILSEYFRKRLFGPRIPKKPLNLIVITDGKPFPDHENPMGVILKWTQYMSSLGIPKNERRVGIMFAQVGLDVEAGRHLQELDNMSTDRDIVDTFKSNLSHVQHWTQDDWNFKVIKLLLGAIDAGTDRIQQLPQQQWQPVASTSAYPQGGYSHLPQQSPQQPPAYNTANTAYANHYNQSGRK